MIRFRPLLLPTLWFVPGLFLLVGLGVWQIERLHEKEALIARVQSGLAAPAIQFETALKNGAERDEWRHVSLTGYFLHDREVYLFAQGPMNAVGVQVVTPLVLDNGDTVLVNRGFVPEAKRAMGTRMAGQIEGRTSLSGILRLSQAPGLFTPAPDLTSRLWFVKDVPSMAKAMGVSTLPVIVEADATLVSGGWPLGGQTIVDFPNSHFQYALTWFGLALALSGVYLAYHARHGRITY